MDEIVFCQLTSISECDSAIRERLNFQEKWSWYYWGFPRRIFLSKVCAKYCTRVINTAIALIWATSGKLHLNWPACNLLWKSLQINTIGMFALVGMSCFLEINNFYSTNAFAFVLFCANSIARLHFINSKLFSKQNTIFRKIIGRGPIFKQRAWRGRFYKKRWKPLIWPNLTYHKSPVWYVLNWYGENNSSTHCNSVFQYSVHNQGQIRNTISKNKSMHSLINRGVVGWEHVGTAHLHLFNVLL